MTPTLLQVLFALLFGLVAAEITVQSKSILIVSGWHFVHSSMATLTVEKNAITESIFWLYNVFFLFYGVYLWMCGKARQ